MSHTSTPAKPAKPAKPEKLSTTAPLSAATSTAPSAPPVGEEKLAYRLFTGADDRAFCERVSAALAEGYVLHGGPAASFNGSTVIVAQSRPWPMPLMSSTPTSLTLMGHSRATHELRRRPQPQ